MRQEVLDFFRMVSASFGHVVEITKELAQNYYAILKKAALYSSVGAVAGLVSFWLSEQSQVPAFNTIGVLLWGGIFVFWVIASQPVVVLAEELGEMFSPIKRIVQRVMSALLAFVVVVLTSMNLPAGAAGQQRLIVIVAFVVGAVLLGYQITRRAIGAKLVLVALVMAASIYLPRTFSSLSFLGTAWDISAQDYLTPKGQELQLTLANITGQNPNSPRLFVRGEPAWWCRREPSKVAGFRCFSLPGPDGFTNESLIPISPDIVAEIEGRLISARNRAEEEAIQEAKRQRQAKTLAEQERLRAEQARQQAEEIAYRERYTNRSSGYSQYGVSVQARGGIDSEVSRAVGSAIGSQNTPTILRDRAVSDGVFERLYRGSADEARKLNLRELAEELILGDLTVQFSQNQAIRGATNAESRLEIRVIDTQSGSIVRSTTAIVMSVGYTQAEAREKAIRQLVAKAASRIQ